MNHRIRELSLSLILIVAPALPASAQTVTIFDTVFTPPGYSSGPLRATMFVPAVSNGIGIVFVHGSGGGRGSQRPWCDTLAAYGYMGMSIDYVEGSTYPEEARTAKIAIEFLRRNASRFGVTTNQVVGWGMSRGAWIWGQAVPWDNADSLFNTDPAVNDHLDAAILLYGYYQDYCLPWVQNITTPLLLMHGTADVVGAYEQSVMLYDSLVAHQKIAQLRLFDGAPHAFDLNYPTATVFTLNGLIAKDTALAFLRRTVNPALKVRVSSSSVDCGNVVVLSSDTFAVWVDNIGSSDLRLDSISNSSPDFTLLELPGFPAVLAPRSSIELRFAFHPVETGAQTDVIRLASDDPLHPVVTIALRGKGVSGIARAASGVLYATGPGAPDGLLYSIDVSSAATAPLGRLGVSEIRGLTVRPSTGELYGTSTTAGASDIYRISADSGYAVRMRTMAVGNLRGLAFSPAGVLYGATAGGSLYRIDPVTGDTALVGRAPKLSYSGLAFDPDGGKLWASVRTPIDSIFTLDTATGIPTFIGKTGFNALTASLAFDPRGKLYALIDNGSGEDYLARIDKSTGAGTLVSENPLAEQYLLAIAMAPDSTLTSADDQRTAVLPQRFALEQNYPNPFNPSTKIRFTLPGESFVTLTVYTVLGQTVATLAKGRCQGGEHEVIWDASGVASGVYFYTLRAAAVKPDGHRPFVENKKMLLVR